MGAILIIGMGNRLRRDDGVGLAVANALATRHLPNTTLLTQLTPDLALLTEWRKFDAVIVIDANFSGAAPGYFARIDALSQALPLRNSSYSTHGFGLVETIELARALDALPSQLLVYLVEGATFEDGEGLSPAVSATLPALMAQICTDVSEFAGGSS